MVTSPISFHQGIALRTIYIYIGICVGVGKGLKCMWCVKCVCIRMYNVWVYNRYILIYNLLVYSVMLHSQRVIVHCA